MNADKKGRNKLSIFAGYRIMYIENPKEPKGKSKN